jgi:hypothetical protein
LSKPKINERLYKIKSRWYWKHIKENQTIWLLKKNNPFVRYFTLKELLELDDTDPEVARVRQKIMKSIIVKMLLTSF